MHCLDHTAERMPAKLNPATSVTAVIRSHPQPALAVPVMAYTNAHANAPTTQARTGTMNTHAEGQAANKVMHKCDLRSLTFEVLVANTMQHMCSTCRDSRSWMCSFCPSVPLIANKMVHMRGDNCVVEQK